MGLKETILAADDRSTREAVFVKEWGTTVYVGVTSGRELDSFDASNADSEGKFIPEGLRARLLVRCLYDASGPEGKRIFLDDDAPALGNTSAPALELLFKAARRVNKFDK